jgi:Flp pilus assembly protein TadD
VFGLPCINALQLVMVAAHLTPKDGELWKRLGLLYRGKRSERVNNGSEESARILYRKPFEFSTRSECRMEIVGLSE